MHGELNTPRVGSTHFTPPIRYFVDWTTFWYQPHRFLTWCPLTWAPLPGSHHAPLSLDLFLAAAFPKNFHWRLNESLLKHPITKDKLLTALTEYFQLNTGSVSSPSVLWDAHKAFFWGAVHLCPISVLLRSSLISELSAS